MRRQGLGRLGRWLGRRGSGVWGKRWWRRFGKGGEEHEACIDGSKI
ncbi:hypothetical protein GGR10_000586 [Bartonella chomelii]|uniref:Uncharacterized protein n=1 Tax=Bartonella chomelii TaxID=236402 RepID=A0ABR6E2F7_9HYPH|nr:hypothetical protein [Bartonella chomelii]MBA9082745.1 hypothetical protein [Bartonella chomelii]